MSRYTRIAQTPGHDILVQNTSILVLGVTVDSVQNGYERAGSELEYTLQWLGDRTMGAARRGYERVH